MKYMEAVEWIEKGHSMTNVIPQDPFETWNVRIAQADAEMAKQAYYTIKAGLLLRAAQSANEAK